MKKMSDGMFLFVYGRLREFYSKEDITDIKSLITSPAHISGVLYEYGDDAVVIDDILENRVVHGNLIVASDMNMLLRHTDSFMEFNEDSYETSKYIRVIKEVHVDGNSEPIKAWCYIFPSSRKYELDTKGKLIEEGDWLIYKENMAKKSIPEQELEQGVKSKIEN